MFTFSSLGYIGENMEVHDCGITMTRHVLQNVSQKDPRKKFVDAFFLFPAKGTDSAINRIYFDDITFLHIMVFSI